MIMGSCSTCWPVATVATHQIHARQALPRSSPYTHPGPAALLCVGYDVWMTNVRGNRFSRNHTSLDPDSPTDAGPFWAFSWDHHAATDLPAAVEHVVAATGVERMLYVGYSQASRQ
jgi:pimeloyl-ACP methyl ester carboxylesterase